MGKNIFSISFSDHMISARGEMGSVWPYWGQLVSWVTEVLLAICGSITPGLPVLVEGHRSEGHQVGPLTHTTTYAYVWNKK